MLADLFCCAGGAAVGYHRAGFRVIGYDIHPQPNYPFEFRQRSILDVSADEIREEFDAAHASPTCQWFSRTHGMHKKGRTGGGNGGYKRPRERDARDDHTNLIPHTRELLVLSGLPYVIENVWEARRAMINAGMLCGEMFGLKTYRHRAFETSWPCEFPKHHTHTQVDIAPARGTPRARGAAIQPQVTAQR